MPIPERSFGCAWLPVTAADLPDLVDMGRAIDHIDRQDFGRVIDELAVALDASPEAVAENSVIVRFDNAAVGFGWNRVTAPEDPSRVATIVGGCHPSWRGRGLGEALIAWQVERAAEWDRETRRPGAGTLQVAAEAVLGTRDADLLAEASFRPQRWLSELHQQLSGTAVRAVSRPEGVEVHAWQAGWVDQALALHNRLVAERPRGVPLTARDWASALETAGVDPGVSWVAATEGQLVGYALNSRSVDEPPIGWTEFYAADPSWRARGVLDLLLATTLDSFQEAGLQLAGISVDSDSALGARPFVEWGYELDEVSAWYVWAPDDGYSGARISPPQQDGHP